MKKEVKKAKTGIRVPKKPAASKDTSKKIAPTPAQEQASFDNAKKLNVVYCLQQIQKKFGYLPAEELEKLSRENGIPGVDIYSVATFYNQFKLKQPAKYIVSVCRGTACHVKDSEILLQYLEKLLNIKAGESTPDGRITLEVVRCIGACAKAPAIMVNDTVYGNMDKDKLKQLIDSLR